MNYFEEIKKWIGEITEITLMLIAFGIVFTSCLAVRFPFSAGSSPI